jgi:predicted phosphodiesterase
VRYLVLSDLHANWEAFRAVLHHCRRKPFDAVLMLGDVVGYGAAPNQVVAALGDLPGPIWSIRGNHDKVVTGFDSGEHFNHAAFAAARWTAERLTPAHLRYVRDLPPGPVVIAPGLAICHGSPLDEDAYVLNELDAYEVFLGHPRSVTFFGHTHVTSLFALRGGAVAGGRLTGSGRLVLDPSARYLLNPGSIGQPRDRDRRASYMIYDAARGVVRWYRIPYPVDRAQARIRAAGLPSLLAERLALGV